MQLRLPSRREKTGSRNFKLRSPNPTGLSRVEFQAGPEKQRRLKSLRVLPLRELQGLR